MAPTSHTTTTVPPLADAGRPGTGRAGDPHDLIALGAVGPDLELWTPRDGIAEARWQYEEIFEHGVYDGFDLPADALVVDVGANVGLFSIFLSRQVPGLRVVAFEPMPATRAALRRNLHAHLQHAARIEPVALGARDEEAVAFAFYPLVPGNSTRYPDQKTVQIDALSDVVPADQLAREYAADEVLVPVRRLADQLEDARIDLLKIDVEGAELEVLHGLADHQWPGIARVVLEVQDLDDRLAAVVGLLGQRGFTVDVAPAPMIPASVRTSIVRAVRA